MYDVPCQSDGFPVAVGTHDELSVVEPSAVVEHHADAPSYYLAAVVVDACFQLCRDVVEQSVKRALLTLRHVQSLVCPVSEEGVSFHVAFHAAACRQLFGERHDAGFLGVGGGVEAYALARTEKQQ